MSDTQTALKIRTILVPIDFSPGAARAFEVASDLAEQLGAKLVLLHACHVDVPTTPFLMAGGPLVPPGFYEALRENANAGIDEFSARARARGLEASGVVLEAPAAPAILEQAQKQSADLIVMGTRGNSGMKHLLLGSVAERVLKGANCPVLTVRADEG